MSTQPNPTPLPEEVRQAVKKAISGKFLGDDTSIRELENAIFSALSAHWPVQATAPAPEHDPRKSALPADFPDHLKDEVAPAPEGTPLTDAASLHMPMKADSESPSGWCCVVRASFARSLETQLAQSQRDLSELRIKLTRAEADRDREAAKVDKQDKDLAAGQEELANIQTILAAMQNDNEDKRAKLTAKEAELAEARAAIEQMPTCRCGMSTDDQCELAGKLAAARQAIAALRAEKGPRWAELQRAEKELSQLRTAPAPDAMMKAAEEIIDAMIARDPRHLSDRPEEIAAILTKHLGKQSEDTARLDWLDRECELEVSTCKLGRRLFVFNSYLNDCDRWQLRKRIDSARSSGGGE